MKLRFTIRAPLLTLFVAVPVSSAVRGVALAAEVQDVDVKQNLIRLWDENRAAFSKCHLRCKVIRRIPDGQVAKKDVDDLLSELPKDYLGLSENDAIHDLAEIFKLGIDKSKPVWGTLELWTDGKKMRQEQWYNGELTHVLIHTRAEEAYLRVRNNQLDLFKPGGSRMKAYSPFDFSPIPKIAANSSIEIVDNSESPTVEVRIKGTMYQVDRASGFVQKLMRESKNEVYELIAVDGPAKSAKVPFPRSIVELTFRENLLASVQLVVFEEVSFSEPIPESKFRIGIDSPTKVFDYRENPKKPKFAGFFDPTPDVVAEVDK